MKTTCSICKTEIFKLREITHICPDSETAAARFENALHQKELNIRDWAEEKSVFEREITESAENICIDCEIELRSERIGY